MKGHWRRSDVSQRVGDVVRATDGQDDGAAGVVDGHEPGRLQHLGLPACSYDVVLGTQVLPQVVDGGLAPPAVRCLGEVPHALQQAQRRLVVDGTAAVEQLPGFLQSDGGGLGGAQGLLHAKRPAKAEAVLRAHHATKVQGAATHASIKEISGTLRRDCFNAPPTMAYAFSTLVFLSPALSVSGGVGARGGCAEVAGRWLLATHPSQSQPHRPRRLYPAERLS